MKKLLTLAILITSHCLVTHAQKAIVSGGGMHENSSGYISWSLGELAISTLKTSEYIITQGFQQSKLTVTAIDEETDIPTKVKTYPNPTSDYLYIEVDGDIANLRYEVYTLSGLNISGAKFDSTPQKIVFARFSSGVYIIRVRLNNQIIKTFRVVKN